MSPPTVETSLRRYTTAAEVINVAVLCVCVVANPAGGGGGGGVPAGVKTSPGQKKQQRHLNRKSSHAHAT